MNINLPDAYPIMKSTYTSRNLKRSLKRIWERKIKGKLRLGEGDIHGELIFRPVSNLLYHYAVGASELQASGEVKCVHPAQNKCKHHHGHIGLDARQVESSCDYDQHRVDETREDREKLCQRAGTLLQFVKLQ